MATFTNQAKLTYAGQTILSNLATGEIVSELAITKTALTETYSADGSVTYIVSLVNSGASAYTDLTVTDDLGGYLVSSNTVYPLAYVSDSIRYYSNGVLQTAPTVTAGPPMSITGITVPANGNVILIYEADVTQYAPLSEGSQINNTASVSGGTLAETLSAEETVTLNNESQLTVTKSVTPTSVTDGDTVTYTFVIENNGSDAVVATDNAVIADTFNPILSNLAVAYNGTAQVEGTGYTYVPATGVFTTAIGLITVPAATFMQDPTTGVWFATPGISTLTVSGTI